MQKKGKGIRRVKSNLVNDPELTARFDAEALRVAKMSRYKFFSVYEEMDAEDVVSECWRKILMQDISYEQSKSGFSTFVNLIVTSKLIDLTRTITGVTHMKNTMSIDLYHDCGDTRVPISEVIPDKVSESNFRLVEMHDEIEYYISIFTNVPRVRDIFCMLERGYTLDAVSSIVGVDYDTVATLKKVVKQIHHNRLVGKDVPFFDILYYESQDWLIEVGKDASEDLVAKSKKDNKRRDLLLDFSHLVKDADTGVSLYHIVRMVLRNFTYARISEKLNISVDKVKDILRTYEPVMI